MEPIPIELVEETWQEVARFDPDIAGKEMMKAGDSQPELLTFMVEFTQDLNQEVQELAIYMFFVVYRMFQKRTGCLYYWKKRILVLGYCGDKGCPDPKA